MTDYYPEFYLRKRQREQSYRRWTVFIVGLLILAGVGAVIGYFVVNAITTRRTPPGATPQLAEQQQQLQTAAQLASSSVPKDVLDSTAEQPPVDLSKVAYSESFPEVSVKLEGASAKPEGDADAAADPAATTDAVGEQPPAVGRDGADGTATDGTAAEAPADNSNAAVAPQPTGQDTRVGSVTPSDDDSKRKADQAKRQEQARREAEKLEAKKRADEKKKREALKQKQAEQEKAAAPAKTEDADKDVRAPAPKKAAGYSYTVYGGTYLNSDDAEKDRAKLGALGLSGNVIHTAGDYLLVVGRLDDADSAAALKNKLNGSGFGGAFTTRKAR